MYEAGGRTGREGDQLLRSITIGDDDLDGVPCRDDMRQRIAVALQRENALCLLGACPPAGGWPWLLPASAAAAPSPVCRTLADWLCRAA